MATALVDIFGTEPANFDRIILRQAIIRPTTKNQCPRHALTSSTSSGLKGRSSRNRARPWPSSRRQPSRARHRDRASSETDWSIELRTATASAS